MMSGASWETSRVRLRSRNRTELMFQVTSEKAMGAELEHEAGSADNAERPAAGGEEAAFRFERPTIVAGGEQRQAALVAGLGGGAARDLGERFVADAGAGERGGGSIPQPRGDLGDIGEGGEQRLGPEAGGALPPQRPFEGAFRLPPLATPVRPLRDSGRRGPSGDRRDRTRRETERRDIGLGFSDQRRRQAGSDRREPRQAEDRGGESGEFGRGRTGPVGGGAAHAASATSGSLSLRWPSTRSRTRFRKSARISSLVRCLMPYLR